MPDSKITALASTGTGTDPANDPLVIVDVSDTSMAASGTTKKVTLNNLLACSPTATLASATITGDLTVNTNVLKVDSTNDRVGIGTASPQQTLDVSGTINSIQARFGNVNGRGLTIGTALVSGVNEAGSVFNALGSGSGVHIFQVDSVEQYRIAPLGVNTWSDGAGGTRMTLNSTGLGIGASPSTKLHVSGTGTQTLRVETLTSGNPTLNLLAAGQDTCSILYDRSNNYMRFDVGSTTGALILSRDGNVGVGVTSSAWLSSYRSIDILAQASFFASNTAGFVGSNIYVASGGVVSYKTANNASYFAVNNSGVFSWYRSNNTPVANGAATFTESMQLDANGNLILLSSNTPATLAANGQLTVNATSNTNLRFSYRGSDGVTRVANITLA
jgi:hypothetical protein